ncbi:MAG: hypothetical protein M1825_004456 [Sarcosagium campestre]|nr:MAG: hypothetical protein M1825_004456 [Sarcosagium campestre]
MEDVPDSIHSGFDEWYQYATERNSFVIDDYDSIYDDLLPFWSLSPAELRSRTWESTSNAWNGISAIRIRNGETDLGPNTIPTHRWMVEGVAELIAPFAKHLPDVAMAFNLNDECRVAVPWKEANAMYASGRQGHEPEGALSSSWSKDRPGDWKDVPEESIPQTRFSDNNLANTFRNWGAVTCPTVSASQKTIRDQRADCVTCSQPHSYGHFVQNWTKAADICHQPDLEHLHGIFLSPAAYKGTHELMPVFSQSKVLGFNDIRYPSAWNYVDKVKYDPSDKYPDPAFKTKMNTLFWRGGTSEGLSVHGTWKGMVRQRLVSLARGRWPHLITALIPIGSNSNEYEYKKVPASELNEKLELDIGIVDKIDRCNGHDCDDEAQEFEFKEPVDFQEHWRYKYLFDLDGAGFSGRFLPFLESHSVPFKVALFREWYDSRLTPWLHFVPQDVRLQGVHSTLAYFVGLDGRLAGRRVTMEAHNEQGEKIAEAGRVLAKKALRKEDMEIYFYRLLLEWARLTDDRRDELGFTA